MAINIMEAVKIFQQAATAKNNRDISSSFWKDVENQNLIPERPADRLRQFYRENKEKGLIKFIDECLSEKNIRFSHNMEEVPIVQCYSIPEQRESTAAFERGAVSSGKRVSSEVFDPNANEGREQSIQEMMETVDKKRQKFLQERH